MLYEIIEALEKSKIVKEIIFKEADALESASVIKIRASLENSWILQVWQHQTPDLLRYSYHVFDKDNKTIVRWDNAPHHEKISTYPYHKHEKDRLVESDKMNIKKVLEELEKIVQQNT